MTTPPVHPASAGPDAGSARSSRTHGNNLPKRSASRDRRPSRLKRARGVRRTDRHQPGHHGTTHTATTPRSATTPQPAGRATPPQPRATTRYPAHGTGSGSRLHRRGTGAAGPASGEAGEVRLPGGGSHTGGPVSARRRIACRAAAGRAGRARTWRGGGWRWSGCGRGWPRSGRRRRRRGVGGRVSWTSWRWTSSWRRRMWAGRGGDRGGGAEGPGAG